jgi:ferric-dicitrate binding protein FerR (iron transport regulator)
MSGPDLDDAVWNAAWAWVIREHEQSLDDAARAELIAWLRSDRAHLARYEEASRVWLASALIPSPKGTPGDPSS